jgi:hypothetical protein
VSPQRFERSQLLGFHAHHALETIIQMIEIAANQVLSITGQDVVIIGRYRPTRSCNKRSPEFSLGGDILKKAIPRCHYRVQPLDCLETLHFPMIFLIQTKRRTRNVIAVSH